MLDDLALDAPVLDDVVDDQILDDAVEGEGAEERPEDETAAALDTKEPEGDERRISQKWRELKATHPELFKEYKGLRFGKEALESKLKDFDLDGVKSWLEEKGGRESLETAFAEMETKASELDAIYEAVASGNPDLPKELAELHPEGFGKLAEATLNQWAQTNPEDYGRVMSGIMASTLQSSGVPMFLERMAMYLEVGKTAEVGQAIQQMQQWAGAFGQAAAKPAQAPPKTDQVAQREQALSQREQKIYSENYLGKLEAQRRPMIEDALKDYKAMRPESAGTHERALRAAIESVEQTLSKDQQFVRAVQAFHAKGDAEGALRLVRSRESRVVAEIAKAVGEDFYGKLGAKTGVRTTPRPTPVPTARKAQADVKPKDKFAAIFAS